MADNKKYYWLKLKEGFFNTIPLKKLRKIAGGDTYTIIYLKLQLLSLSGEGMLYYEGVEDDFIEELALAIDEDVDNVKFTVLFLEKCGLLERINEGEILLTAVPYAIGKESDSAKRVRAHRERKKQLALQCNDGVTNGNTEIETEKEKELETEPETEREKVDYQRIRAMYNDTCVSFPRLTTLSEARKKAIKARLKTYTYEDFQTLFTRAEASDFLKGANERNWSATFDWLIKDSNFAKVLEGNYDKKPATQKQSKNQFNNYPQRQYDIEAYENMLLKRQNPPKTAGEDESIRERAEALKAQLGGK